MFLKSPRGAADRRTFEPVRSGIHFVTPEQVVFSPDKFWARIIAANQLGLVEDQTYYMMPVNGAVWKTMVKRVRGEALELR